MSRSATIILNRNLPEVADALYNRINKYDNLLTDVYIVEAGSREKHLSKNCTWWANWPDSIENGLRVPRGFNFALSELFKEGRFDHYDYFFLLPNDTEFPDGPVLKPLMEIMEKHPRLGMLSPCSRMWGEIQLMDIDVKYVWYVSHIGLLVRKNFVLDVCDLESPDYMNFLYDGNNFRGYESDIELIVKGYANDWATAITTQVIAEENEEHLIYKHTLIETDEREENLNRYVEEGRRWLRKKYGFKSRWNMQQYSKFMYEQFFYNFPEYKKYRL